MSKKFKVIISLILLISFSLLFILNINVLIVKDISKDKIVFINKVVPGDEFTMEWMHSVELLPWEEIFRIDDNYDIVLDRTRFKQFGAGVPDYAGNKTEIKDGYIIFSGINKKINPLPYGVSDFAKHTFYFKDREIKLYEIIEDGVAINIFVKKIKLIDYLMKTIN